MTTPVNNSQMHNDIMATSSIDRPPMLATGRYAHWQSRFLRYVDMNSNKQELKKFIFNGPYVMTKITVLAKPSTTTEEAVPEHNVPKTFDTCTTAKEMWIAIEQLQQGKSLNKQDVKTNLFWEFGKFTSKDGESIESYYSRFYSMMNEMYQMEVNEIRAEMIAKNAIPLTLIAATQQPLAKACRKPKRVKDYAYHKGKMMLCKQEEKGVPEVLTAESGPNFDAESLEKVQPDDKYNVFANAPESTVDAEKEAIHLLLTGIGDDIYSIVDAYKTAQDMWVAIERIQQVPKPHKSYAPPPKKSSATRSHASTRHKGKEIAKPITPPSGSASEEDSNPEQALRDKDMQKNLARIAKYFKKLYKSTNNKLRTYLNSRNKNADTTLRYVNENQTSQFRNQRTVTVVGARETVGSQKAKRAKDYTYHKEKMLLCKQAKKGVPLQAEQADWLEDRDEEIDEQEMEAHYSFMANIQEVLPADSGSDVEPVEKRVVLATLIANLQLDIEENKKIQKKLKKANASLAQELKECKSTLEETNRTRDRYLVALHDKEVELAKEETLTLEQESRSKLNKDIVKPYDYTQQNNLYEIFKPPTREYLDKLAHANEVRKKIWRKSFIKNKPHMMMLELREFVAMVVVVIWWYTMD
ncbi:hypothetical protein Tco_1420442 [Tanacetum coccineum]